MTRALAVAALVGCACGQSAANAPATTCPASPAVPAVELSLCPVERPTPSLVVTEPADDSWLIRGSGFWCTALLDGKLAGESYCFRYREPCEEFRQEFHERYAMAECRRAERASCVRITDYKRVSLFYRCYPRDQCEAIRARMVARFPDLRFGECREME